MVGNQKDFQHRIKRNGLVETDRRKICFEKGRLFWKQNIIRHLTMLNCLCMASLLEGNSEIKLTSYTAHGKWLSQVVFAHCPVCFLILKFPSFFPSSFLSSFCLSVFIFFLLTHLFLYMGRKRLVHFERIQSTQEKGADIICVIQELKSSLKST